MKPEISIHHSPLHRGRLTIPVKGILSETPNLLETLDSNERPQNQTSVPIQVIAPADAITSLIRHGEIVTFSDSPLYLILSPGDSFTVSTTYVGDLVFIPIW